MNHLAVVCRAAPRILASGVLTRLAMLAFALASTMGATQVARAASPDEIERLSQALRLGEIIEVMVEEGHLYGESLGEDMLVNGGGPAWAALVDRIYDAEKMRGVAAPLFAKALEGAEVTPLIAYFESDLGRTIVEHEIAARRLFLDDTAEQAAREVYRGLPPEDRRLQLVQEYMQVNSLVDFNVSGAMNANFMFYRGLAEGGAYDANESEMLQEVWSQAEETRADSEEWLSAYLLTAFADLDDGAVQSYTELSRTPAGRALNAALFEAFDAMYRDISYALGLAVAAEMAGEDL